MANFLRQTGRLALTCAILAGIIAVVSGPWACSPQSYSGKVESITVGMEPNAVNALIYIAENRHFFTGNGLNVTVKDYASGSDAVDGLLNGEVDIATAAEFVIVRNAFAGKSIRTLGTINKFMHIFLIARRDHGIADIPDLKGKRIGLSLKTASEFYLGRFLELRGMSTGQATLVNLSPQESVDALVNGDIDAVIAWQPYVKAIEDRLGNGIIRWPAQSQQAAFDSAVSTDTWTSGHPELARRFLNSLNQAYSFSLNHPADAMRIVQNKLNYEDQYIATLWQQYQLSLSLDQSLIAAMEDEARWMISSGLTGEKQIPDFLNYIYLDGMMAVKPEAVNIIR